LRRVAVVTIALFLILTASPSWPTGSGSVNLNAGPHILNLNFDELPRPWWGGSWWDANWTHREKLRFDAQSINEDLIDFPVLIVLNGSRVDYASTQDSGEDLRFIDADGLTVLEHEIESWNETGTTFVWVKVPSIDRGSTTDHIWMYYGNSNAMDGQNPNNVWDSNYVTVQHLDERSRTSGSDNDNLDSTSNGHNLEAYLNGSHLDVTGAIGSAVELDGFNEYIASAGDEFDATEDVGTLEMMVRANNMTSTSSILNTLENRDRAIWIDAGQYNAGMATGLLSSIGLRGGNVDTQWHHIVFSWDINNGELYLYVDGGLVDNYTGPSWSSSFRFPSTNYGHFEFLNLNFPLRGYFDGMMDEIRVSSIVRSGEWNDAQYRSMTDSFVTFDGTGSYPYRQKITLDASTSSYPAGYAVTATFDHASLVLSGKSRAFGGDVRIVYWDSSRWVELDRVLDTNSTWNSTYTEVMFRLQNGINISESDSNYYIYYGNPSATIPPINVTVSAGTKNVQSGTAVSTANGITVVPISPVDMSRSFLIFNSRHDSNRPVGYEIGGSIASPTTLEFERVTNEAIPVPMTIQWYVVEYESGVRVQRGVSSLVSTTTNVAISPISATDQAFLTWSRTPAVGDQHWNYDDLTVGEITSTSNIQFRLDSVNSAHRVFWQVIEFTNPGDIDVQMGSVFSMTGTTTSVNATLGKPVSSEKTFILTGFRTPHTGQDMGARMLSAQLTNSTNIVFERSAIGDPDNITEIFWQAVELNDGSRVLSGMEHFAPGQYQKNVNLSDVIDTNRSAAFASVQIGCGQSLGRTPFIVDDKVGIASVTMALSPTQIIMERDNATDEADIGWFVVEFKRQTPQSSIGPEETSANVQIVASVYHTRPDGTDPRGIVTSPTITIDSTTTNPLSMNIGNGVQYTFTDSNPRLLSLEINVTAINGGERFVLAYDSASQPTSLITPTSPTNTYYLYDTDTSGISPSGKVMNTTMGSGGANFLFDTFGQRMYWYASMWSPLSVSILTPVMDEHMTGTYDITYSTSAPISNISFEYLEGASWRNIGYDSTFDGTFIFDSCAVGDRITDIRATARTASNSTAQDIVTNIEIDCTPPSIQILQPLDFTEVNGTETITYIVDPDAVLVELRYDDGQLHTIATEAPPDGTAVWTIGNLTLKGVILRGIAWDEVGLSSEDQVSGLSTPEPITPISKPPTISGVPDIIVHYDYSYNFDLTPYISDEDTPLDQLTISTSDSAHIWTNPLNNLGLVMNYPLSMLNQTVQLTIWVTDGNSSDFQVINITILDDYPPEKLHLLPDVSFDEDETVLNVFFTNMDYYFLDIDGDNLYYTSGNNSVKIRINANKTVDMWAEPDWFGFEIITIRATDPTGALVEDVVIVQVNPINDAPIIDYIPDITTRAGSSRLVDIIGYVHDVDNSTGDLVISVDSEHVTTDGFNLTLSYPSGMNDDLIRITVSDGVNSSYVDVRVIIESDENFGLWLVLFLTAVVILLMSWFYVANKPEIFVGYLIREDGALIREVSMTDKRTVPYGLIREKTKAPHVGLIKNINFGTYKVAILHGKRLHLAVVSSAKLEVPTRAELQEIVKGIDHDVRGKKLLGDESKETASILDGFENHFREIGKNYWPFGRSN
jgi:hypothetical protein